MRVGIIGAGRIGGMAARVLVQGGHEVKLSFTRDAAKLAQLAEEVATDASAGTPREAVEFGEVIVFAVPWDVIPEALEQAGTAVGHYRYNGLPGHQSLGQDSPAMTGLGKRSQRGERHLSP